MATFDALISEIAQTYIGSLNTSERANFYAALNSLLQDPYSDRETKVELYFPYRPGTLGAEVGDFWFAYTFENNLTLYIAQVYWRPGSPGNPSPIGL